MYVKEHGDCRACHCQTAAGICSARQTPAWRVLWQTRLQCVLLGHYRSGTSGEASTLCSLLELCMAPAHRLFRRQRTRTVSIGTVEKFPTKIPAAVRNSTETRRRTERGWLPKISRASFYPDDLKIPPKCRGVGLVAERNPRGAAHRYVKITCMNSHASSFTCPGMYGCRRCVCRQSLSLCRSELMCWK